MLNTKIIKYAILSLAVCLVITSAFVAVNAKPAAAATFGDFEYSITADSTAEITGYTGPGGDVVIPGTITDNGTDYPVKAIADRGDQHGVFYDRRDITSITIPNSLTTIGGYAFQYCVNMTAVNFEEGSALTTIKQYAFNRCIGLLSITVPESALNLETNAFDCCMGLSEVKLPSGLTSLSPMLFRDCRSLKTIMIPDGVTIIGNGAFVSSGLEEITIPDGVTDIESNVFQKTNLSEVTIPATVTILKSRAFADIPSLHALYFLGACPPGMNSLVIYPIPADFVLYYHITEETSWTSWKYLNRYTSHPFCTLTVDLNDSSDPASSYAVVTGGHIAAPADPVREGYTFGGWYSDAACTTAYDFAGQTVTDDVTVYAKWTQGIGIVGDINGDECVDLLDISLATDYMMETSIPTAEEFTKADVNQDECIDLLDVSLITDIAMEF